MNNQRNTTALRRTARRLLALFGLAVAAGAPLAALAPQATAQPTAVEIERAALDARVAQLRAGLLAQAAPTPKKAPWANWGNWNNWPNWGNWFNTR